jgi:glutaredoxin 3
VAEIEIYTTPFCGFCYRAKKLFADKGVPVTEYDVMMSAARRKEMRERAGGDNKVPQVFIDGRHIGGSDKLDALAGSGELDRLLGVEA